MTTHNSQADELREVVHRIAHQLVHPEMYGFAPDPDKATNTIMEAIARHTKEAVARACIEEIEDIDQSRDIEDDGDIIWCTSCEMTLEDENETCGCNHLYEKRRQRIAMLRAELSSGQSKGGGDAQQKDGDASS